MKSKATAARVFATLLLFISSLVSSGRVDVEALQVPMKTLDIERNRNEPFVLVGLRVNEQELIDKVTTKFRQGSQGFDTVGFNADNGWFRNITVSLKNVSERPFFGIQASLYFKPSTDRVIFSVDLTAASERGQGVVQPGEKATLRISDDAWLRMEQRLKQHQVDADQAAVSLVVNTIGFGPDLQWSHGQLLRPDPNNPLRWNVVAEKDRP